MAVGKLYRVLINTPGGQRSSVLTQKYRNHHKGHYWDIMYTTNPFCDNNNFLQDFQKSRQCVRKRQTRHGATLNTNHILTDLGSITPLWE